MRSVEQVLKAQRGAARMAGAQEGGKPEGQEAAAAVTSLEQLLRSFAEALRRVRQRSDYPPGFLSYTAGGTVSPGTAFGADLAALAAWCSQLATSKHLSPGFEFAGGFTVMFTNKKHFSAAIIGALVALSIIALVLSLVKIEDVTLPPTVKYGMVFDAGSSHTSLFVYEWDSDKKNNTGVVSQSLSCDVQGQCPLAMVLPHVFVEWVG
ncbi:hypothetical protein Q9233_012971 [Columba guinea]|nr:hypothetical protein Q9233_012971 [Columba guinea]